MWRTIFIAFIFVLLCSLCTQVVAQDGVTPGKATTVTCKHDANQKYACYVPSKYTKGKKWPILYCFAPNANGMAFVKLFKDACERHGWIVIGSNNARNGPGGPIEAAVKAMWKDTRARFSINDKRCYSSGFSGGSGMAFDMAQNYPDYFAGVIPMALSQSLAQKTPDVPTYVSVYFIIGDRDAVSYAKKRAKAFREKGNKAEVKTFSGGHQMPPKNVAEGAIDWLEKNKPKRGKSADSMSENPTQIELKPDVAKRLKSAVQKAKRGDLGSALRIAQKVLEDEGAKEEEKTDAKYIKEEIEKRANELFAEADNLLSEKMPYEAKELLVKIRKAFTKMDEAKKAQEKIKEIDSDEELKDELMAGKLFAKALQYEDKGKEKQAKKYFKQVVEKYPDTEYAKRAKEKM